MEHKKKQNKKAMYEEETENVMHDSLNLFSDICNNQYFVETSMILFLNKSDLFAEKISKVPLSVCFEDYEDGKSFEKCLARIRREFIARNNNKQKQIYVHV